MIAGPSPKPWSSLAGLPFYQQEFAADLAEPEGLLSQAFTVKGINEIRAFTLRAPPLLQQIAARQGDNHAEVMQRCVISRGSWTNSPK